MQCCLCGLLIGRRDVAGEKLHSAGERHAPCGTPLRKVVGGTMRWEMRMETVLSVMKFEKMRVKEGCMLGRSILCLSPSC